MKLLIKNISNGRVATSKFSLGVGEQTTISLEDAVIGGDKLQDNHDYQLYSELLQLETKGKVQSTQVMYTGPNDAPTLNNLTANEIIDLAQFEGDFLTKDQTLQQVTTGQLKFPTAKFGDSSNNTEFEADGTIKFNGNATVYRDINFAGTTLATGPTPPDIEEFYGGGGIYGRAFAGTLTTVEQLFGIEEIQHDYKEGTDLEFHVHWTPTTTASGNVKWQIAYNWLEYNAVGGAPTVISVIQAASGVAWSHQKSNFINISGVGHQIQGQFHFRLFRDPTDSQDTYAADAALLSVGIHYQVDGVGSRQTNTK